MSGFALTLTEDQMKAVIDGKDIEFSEDQVGSVKAHLGTTVAATEMSPEIARRFAEMEAEKTRMAAEVKAARESVMAMERANKRREFAEFVRSNRMAFQGDVDEVVGKIEKYSEALPADLFVAYMDERKLFAERLRESGLFSQVGSENGKPATVGDEFKIKVAAEMAKGVSEPEATVRVATENPTLYNRYDQEMKRIAKGGN